MQNKRSESPIRLMMAKIDLISPTQNNRAITPSQHQQRSSRETRPASSVKGNQKQNKFQYNSAFLTPMRNVSSGTSSFITSFSKINAAKNTFQNHKGASTEGTLPSQSNLVSFINQKDSNSSQGTAHSQIVKRKHSLNHENYQSLHGSQSRTQKQAVINTEMSPSRRGTLQTSQSMLFNSSISSQNLKHREISNEKTQVSKLGLKLQPICMKQGHERSKIFYVCTDLFCQVEDKFGCAHCFLDQHGDHAMQKLKLDDFFQSINQKHSLYRQSVCNLNNIASLMAQPTFLKDFLIQLDRVKENTVLQIDRMKKRVEEHIQEDISGDLQDIASEMSKQDTILRMMSKTFEKNLFEMNEEEFKCALNMHHEAYFQDLLRRTKVIQDRYNDLDTLYCQSFNGIYQSLCRDIENVLSVYSDFDVLIQESLSSNAMNLPNILGNESFSQSGSQNQIIPSKIKGSYSVHNTQETAQIHNTEQNTHEKPKRQKIQKETVPTADILSANENVMQRYQSERKKNDSIQEVKLTQSDVPEKTKASKKVDQKNKQSEQFDSNDSLCQNVKLIEEIKNIQNDIYYLSIKNNFPYIIYKSGCTHNLKCNTVPIFECCKQAYPCTTCHDLHAKHRHIISTPSKRYCMRCFKVFNVAYFTNIAINCKECLQIKNDS